MIADDHKMLSEALRALLASRFDVVGMVPDGRALLELAPKLKPDVVLVDVGMPLLNGLEASRQLKSEMPGVKVIMITQSLDASHASLALRQGASGYVLKQSAATELFDAIAAAMRGKTFVTRQIASSLEKAFIQDPRSEGHPQSLTPRQREVVHLLAEGKSMKEAASILRISRRTIAFHKYRIMGHYGLKSTAELVQFAIKNYLLVS